MPPLPPPAVATARPSPPSQQQLHLLLLAPDPSSTSLPPIASPPSLEAEAAPACTAAHTAFPVPLPESQLQSQSATHRGASPGLSLSSLSRRLSLLMRRRASSSSSSSSQESSPSSVEATSTAPLHPYTNSAGPDASGSSLSVDYGSGSRRQSLFRRLSLSRRSSGSSPGGSETPSPTQASRMVQRQKSSSPRPENAPALAKSASGFRGRRGHRHDGGAGPSPLSVGTSSSTATSPTTVSPDKLGTIRAAAALPRGATGDPTYLDTALWRPPPAPLDSVAAPFVTAPAAERDRDDGGNIPPEGAKKELEEFEAAARAAAASHRPPEPRVKRGLFRKLSRGLLADSTESGAGGAAGSVGLNEPFRRRRSVLNMAWSPPRGTDDDSPAAAADHPKPTGVPRTRSLVNGSATVSRGWLKNAPLVASSEGVGVEETRRLETDVGALTDMAALNVVESTPTSAPVAGSIPYMDFSKLAAPLRDLDEACAVEHTVVRPLLAWRHYDDEEGLAGIFLAPRIPQL
ncbi:hypothetical protein HK405_008441 [Cladochytrium tenue]|nr:hypothetical protein HK405_008441 [Cladochytrium tenue]